MMGPMRPQKSRLGLLRVPVICGMATMIARVRLLICVMIGRRRVSRAPRLVVVAGLGAPMSLGALGGVDCSMPLAQPSLVSTGLPLAPLALGLAVPGCVARALHLRHAALFQHSSYPQPVAPIRRRAVGNCGIAVSVYVLRLSVTIMHHICVCEGCCNFCPHKSLSTLLRSAICCDLHQMRFRRPEGFTFRLSQKTMPWSCIMARDWIYRVVLPPLLGAFGAILAAAYPAFHTAICSAPVLGV